MESIPLKQLRNQVSEVLRRVEGGETMLVTVAGRPAAELHPAGGKRWVGGPALERVWQRPAPTGLRADLCRLGAELVDPFA